MTAGPPLYVGIDLGTTNSAAAVFNGERIELIRNPEGAMLTPSVVRIDGRGNVTVGARARRMMERDPENVRAEFKRLMGTPHALAFAASGLRKRPEELAAEVLRGLRADVLAQVGVLPDRAVISVPALFELPQTAATSEAARLAGFERVEMIQEPIASALAAGWKAEESAGPWLVYDLGGGTFDVSLLESQEGLLRVMGHDGDNFLGGRDFDGAIVDWAIERIGIETSVSVERANPAHAVALRHLRVAAEAAKIELTRAREAEIIIAGLNVGGRAVDVELVLERAVLEKLVEALVVRSVAICHRLLAAHGIVPRDGALSRVVLVGGPTAMPFLRSRIAELLSAPFGEGLDPMTLVAQGAALYAANAGLDGRPSAPATSGTAGTAPKVWLQYPAMSSDPHPFVVGKLVDPADRARVAAVVVRRSDGSWSSEPEPIDADGTFALMTSLTPRVSNDLVIEGRGPDGVTVVAVAPPGLTIVHGVTLGDPPLSRSVGVALANDRVQVFFERGRPLPMRRTFALRTVEALSPADPGAALRVPIVQGEFGLAHLCRVVGALEIQGRGLNSVLAANSAVDVTIELDRCGRLQANARIPQTSQVFDHVATLVAGVIPIAELGSRLRELMQRLQSIRARAFQHRERVVVEKLATADGIAAQAVRDEEAARGGDLDAGEKARRLLIDLDALLADAEAALAWPDLDARIREDVAIALSRVGQFGTTEERAALSSAIAAIEKARVARNPHDVDRQAKIVRHLGATAYLRSPGAWRNELEYLASIATDSMDPKRAMRLLEEGRAAAAADDEAGVERAVRALWLLRPLHADERALGHGSGVR